MTTIISGPGLESRNVEDPRQPLTGAQLAGILMGTNSRRLGGSITPATSMRISTVLACVRIISFAIARMPLLVYSRTAEGRARATDHPYFQMLSMRPNPGSPAFSFVQALVSNLMLWGNAYAEIVRNGAGLVQSLHVIESSRVQPRRLPGDSELTYDVYTPGREPVTLLANEILHVPGLSFNGLCGVSVIENARRTLGLAEGTTETAGYLQQQGLRPGGYLKAEGTLSPDAQTKLKADFDTTYSGPQNAGRVIMLPKGVTFESAGTTIPPGDAQLVESRKMSRVDIAEIFGVPLSMLGAIEGAGNNNVEAASLDFLNYTLSPWITLFQQEVNYKLFGDSTDTYAEFLTQVVLAMDAKTRGEFYRQLRDLSAINSDEVRDRENFNHIPDERGRVYYVPSNMMPAPTPAQADQLLEAWMKKTSGAGAPNPQTDGKVAGSANNS